MNKVAERAEFNVVVFIYCCALKFPWTFAFHHSLKKIFGID